MDETDLFLIKKLMTFSRLTYRELAEESNLSVSAVHKRVQQLVEEGTINAFIVRPTVVSTKSIWILTTGTSTAKSMDDVSQELGNQESNYLIGIASGKFLYIGSYLRDISELQDYIISVSRIAKINKPTVGIINVPYMTTPETLSSIDYKILKTLNRDARKPVTDIADDIGLSPNTIKNRIDRMVHNNLAYFTIEWTPRSDFITIFHLVLKENSDTNSVLKHLYEKYSENLAYCLSFSNIPNYITMHTWAKSSEDSQKIQESLQTEGFKDIVPHVMLYGNYYDCWVDRMLRMK